jgi:hypothetical protein
LTGSGESEVYSMEEGKRGSGLHAGGKDSIVSPDLGWEHLQSAVDEAEAQSFPASDPQSSWAGSDRYSLPWWGDEQ